MKKFMSISLLSAVLAGTFAFAPMAKFVDSWTLYNGTIVTGAKAQVKAQYCPGPDVRLCATKVGGGDTIFRP